MYRCQPSKYDVLWDRMSTPEFSLWIFLSSIIAGLLGSLTGLGGGVVIVPVLTVLFHVDIHYAIGASLVSVIATSSGAAAAYVREGYSNIRIGMFLEIATTLGALFGAWLTTRVPTHAIGIIFGVVLLYSAYASIRIKEHALATGKPDALAARLRMNGVMPSRGRGCTLRRPARSRRLQPDVSGRIALGSARHRLGSGQGPGHGPGYAVALQGLHHHQQLHDRGDGGGQRRNLPQPRVHLAGTSYASHARRTRRLTRRLKDSGSRPGQDAKDCLRRGHRRAWNGNDL